MACACAVVGVVRMVEEGVAMLDEDRARRGGTSVNRFVYAQTVSSSLQNTVRASQSSGRAVRASGKGSRLTLPGEARQVATKVNLPS